MSQKYEPMPPPSDQVDVGDASTIGCCRHHMTLISGLASAMVHMAALVALGLLFATLHQDGEIELHLAMTSPPMGTPFEAVNLDVEAEPPSADARLSDSSSSPAILDLHEPELVMLEPSLDSSDSSVAGDAMESRPRPSNTTDKKGQFFGADAYGDEFVYVVDMSTSMGYRSHYGQTRFRVACRELVRSINELEANQKFCVILFCYRTRFMFDRQPKMIAATAQNKKLVRLWVSRLQLSSGTDPRLGVMTALRLKPDAIFLLSDGEFNGRGINQHGIPGDPTIERIIQKHRKQVVPIHTIAFEDLQNRRRLRSLAVATNGTHRFVGNISDQDLLLVDLRSRKSDDVAYAMQCILEGTHRVRDEAHLKTTVALIGRKLTSRSQAMRELACETLVALADGAHQGPHEEAPTLDDYRAAQKRWQKYWELAFRREATPGDEVADLSSL